MQSGREDTLEERHAIKYCFKLGKNATETYRMLQTAFSTILHESSISFWVGIRRFKEGRESVRDDERCGRSKEVRTPELIGQIKNFIDKDRHVSIETINGSLMSMWELYTCWGTEDAEYSCKVSPKGTQRRSERKTLSWQQGDGWADQFRSRSSWCSGDRRWNSGSTAMIQRPRDRVPSGRHAGSPRLKKARQSKSTHKILMIPFFWQHWHDLHALGFPLDRQSKKEYYVEVLRKFRKRFRWKRLALFKSAQWHFPPGQCTSLQLHPCHRLFDQDWHQHSSLPSPIVPDLGPCDLCLFPKLRGCRYETIEEMKEAVTKVIDTLTQEDFHGVFQKLLEWYNKCIAAGGDYFEGD